MFYLNTNKKMNWESIETATLNERSRNLSEELEEIEKEIETNDQEDKKNLKGVEMNIF